MNLASDLLEQSRQTATSNRATSHNPDFSLKPAPCSSHRRATTLAQILESLAAKFMVDPAALDAATTPANVRPGASAPSSDPRIEKPMDRLHHHRSFTHARRHPLHRPAAHIAHRKHPRQRRRISRSAAIGAHKPLRIQLQAIPQPFGVRRPPRSSRTDCRSAASRLPRNCGRSRSPAASKARPPAR